MEFRGQVIYSGASGSIHDTVVRARTYADAASKILAKISDTTNLGGVVLHAGPSRPNERVMRFRFQAGRLVPMQARPTQAHGRKTDSIERDEYVHLLTIEHDGKKGQLFRE